MFKVEALELTDYLPCKSASLLFLSPVFLLKKVSDKALKKIPKVHRSSDKQLQHSVNGKIKKIKGVLIDFNHVISQFWGHIRTQGTWLPHK